MPVLEARGLVTTLQMRAALHTAPGTVSDVPSELSALVYSLDAVLILVTVTTLVAVVLLSVRQRIRDLGALKAIGLTPAQLTSSLFGAQGLLAAFAALLSIPLGIGLYLGVLGLTSGTVHGAVLAPWWHVALVPVAVAPAVATTASIPARLAAAVPVAEAVRYE